MNGRNGMQDQVVVLTGASRGVGRCLAKRLLARGAVVIGVARDGAALDSLVCAHAASRRDGTTHGSGRFIPVACDVADAEAVRRQVGAAVAALGRVDLLINNAGVGLTASALATRREWSERAMAVNFYGAVNLTETIAPMMIQARAGVIVNVASVVARLGMPTVAHYAAAKAALTAWSQALESELAPAGIRVLTVHPGNTDTGFHTSQLQPGGSPAWVTRGNRLDPEMVADTILGLTAGPSAEKVIGRPAQMLLLLRFLAPRWLRNLFISLFRLDVWYDSDAPLDPGTSSPFSPEVTFPGAQPPPVMPALTGVTLAHADRFCGYHRQKGPLTGHQVLTPGLDPLLFYTLYPYLLATVYTRTSPSRQRFRHPWLPNAGWIPMVHRPVGAVAAVKNVIKTLLVPVRPLGRSWHGVELRVAGHPYAFDLGEGGTVCPAAFRAFFPVQLRSQLEAKDGGTWSGCCPDHLKNLTFAAGNNTLASVPLPGADPVCHWGAQAVLKAGNPCHRQPVPEKDGRGSTMTLEELATQLGVPCPTLLQTALGYYLTLSMGGELAFYSTTFDAAMFQCPSVRSRVAAEIVRHRETGMVTLVVLAINGTACARGFVAGDRWQLPLDLERTRGCLHAFNALYLAAGVADLLPEPITVACPREGCQATWQVAA
ncbi:MAG: SDR family oxidoreductase [Magnetococcales bacterium]|nr:SDR family oxidoreductase [Magnetococcales bacterium]